jgi:hypothetical protein
METRRETESNPEPNTAEAIGNVASAHKILKALQEKIGPHPEIRECHH